MSLFWYYESFRPPVKFLISSCYINSVTSPSFSRYIAWFLCWRQSYKLCCFLVLGKSYSLFGMFHAVLFGFVI